VADLGFEEEEFTTEFSGQALRRIASLIKPYWPWLVAVLVSAGVVSTLESYFAFLDKRLLDEAITTRDASALYRILGVYLVVFFLQALGVCGAILVAGTLGERVQFDLRQRMFNHIQDLSFSYFDKTPVGWIMARVTSDSERISEIITWGILDSLWGGLNVLTSMYFMLIIEWRMALIVFAAIPVLVFAAIQLRKRTIVEYRSVRKTNSRITGAFNETITGVRVVKALGREAEDLREFGELTERMFGSSFRAAWLSALLLPAIQIISALAMGGIVWYGGLSVGTGRVTVGTIHAFIMYVTFMLWPIQELAYVFAEMQHTLASSERVFSLIDAVPDVMDRPGAEPAETIVGDIEFDHVDFYYEEDKPVLSDFTLTVRSGETVALVGPTGGGKTTIVNLICRFYEPSGGTIRFAGRDYTGLTLDSIQSRIGVVLQTPHLFAGTVRDNIRYGRLDSSDAEVEEAARLAGAHEFITGLEDGYDQDVGEGGNLLSVGQRQLISLARAILAEPEIFIMDEATSSVDTLTEALIQRGMRELTERRTSFIIAHRLSTIKRADRILVVEEGRIVEEGTHASLLRAEGHYHRLYTKQFRDQAEVGAELLAVPVAA
jgi:ATP-binding cassette subfamily B protein